MKWPSYRTFLREAGCYLSDDNGLVCSVRGGWSEMWYEAIRKPAPPLPMSELITATLNARSHKLASSITQNNALLRHLQDSKR
jgi:hypothetical protein